MKAISVRQPWAWLIVNGHKPIENRSWPTRFRGRVLVHASKGMTRHEYEDAADLCHHLNVPVPQFEDLERGGFVGSTTITDCITDSESKWFFGKHGFVLQDSKPMPMVPYKGELGFFDVDPVVVNIMQKRGYL